MNDQQIKDFQEWLIKANEQLCQKFGGKCQLIHKSTLDGIVKTPWLIIVGEDAYKTKSEKLNAFARALISMHPFMDGNKRVALAGIEKLADYMRVEWNVSSKYKYEYIMSLADSRRDPKEIKEEDLVDISVNLETIIAENENTLDKLSKFPTK